MNEKPRSAIYLLESIAVGVCDSLEEMGLTAEQATQLIESEENESWRFSVYMGLSNYLKKLKLNGGKPKPPTI